MDRSAYAVDALLAARQALYCYFRYVFGAEPRAGFQDILCDVAIPRAIALFVDDADAVHFQEAVDAWNADRSVDCHAFAEACASERMDRLVGPGQLVAYPWESTWVEGSPVLFRPVSSHVAQAYAACGYRFQASGNAPADHLSTELDFMSRLAEELSNAFAAYAAASFLPVIGSQEDFLDCHLLAWSNRYLRVLEDAAGGFLAPCAAALRAFLEADRQFLSQLRTGCEAHACEGGVR